MKFKSKIRLGVNIDHAATLRQVRGGYTTYPDLTSLAKKVIRAGADQITIHLREDRRHIQDYDLDQLSQIKKIPINLEMAYRKEMIQKALQCKPKWVCLVPESRQELTTEGGLNLDILSDLKSTLLKLKKKKIKVSMFIEPDLTQVKKSVEVHADAVEFHTGAWVLEKNAQKKKKIWDDLVQASELAHSLGLRVHAGHGLDYEHARKILKLPHLQEVNIGHSIICYSLFDGIENVTQKFIKILSQK